MTIINGDKLNIFEKFNGDIDRFVRAARQKEKLLLNDNEWFLIDDFKQRLHLIQNNLVSSEFKEKTLKELKEITDTIAFKKMTEGIKN